MKLSNEVIEVLILAYLTNWECYEYQLFQMLKGMGLDELTASRLTRLMLTMEGNNWVRRTTDKTDRVRKVWNISLWGQEYLDRYVTVF